MNIYEKLKNELNKNRMSVVFSHNCADNANIEIKKKNYLKQCNE